MVSCYIQNWAAWAPNIESKEQWREWADNGQSLSVEGVPKVAFLPAQLRRRLSRISKISLEVAYNCCPAELLSEVRSVFATRHGESSTTIGLLNDIAADDLFSPTAFSHSVHNTAAGYFSIFAQNKNPSTSIAAGRDSFSSGFLECVAQSSRHRETPVLLVFASEPVIDYYQPYVREDQITYGLALLLNQTGPGEEVEFSFHNREEKIPENDSRPLGLAFLQWLVSDGESIELCGDDLVWNWKRVRKPV